MSSDPIVLSDVWNKTILIHQEGARVHHLNNKKNTDNPPDQLQHLIWCECTPQFSKFNSKLCWIIFKTDLKTSYDI